MPRNDKTKPTGSNNAAHIGAHLGNLVRQRRERRTIQQVADEIGVTWPTVYRVEMGGLPNLSSFRKICVWLRIDPAEILGISSKKNEADPKQEEVLRKSAVHLLADQALPEAAAHDLAQLIIFAHRELARRIRED